MTWKKYSANLETKEKPSRNIGNESCNKSREKIQLKALKQNQ